MTMTKGRMAADWLRDQMLLLDCEAEAADAPLYGIGAAVALVGRTTMGNWLHYIHFTAEGKLLPFAGGGRGNPFRGGPAHAAVEAAERVGITGLYGLNVL